MGKFFDWIKSIFRRVIPMDEFSEFLQSMAISAAEAASGLDLNGDGQVSTLSEISRLGREYGVKKLVSFAEAAIPGEVSTDDLKKYFAMAMVAKAIGERFGAGRVPMFRLLSLAVEAGYVFITKLEVGRDLKSKGIE